MGVYVIIFKYIFNGAGKSVIFKTNGWCKIIHISKDIQVILRHFEFVFSLGDILFIKSYLLFLMHILNHFLSRNWR